MHRQALIGSRFLFSLHMTCKEGRAFLRQTLIWHLCLPTSLLPQPSKSFDPSCCSFTMSSPTWTDNTEPDIAPLATLIYPEPNIKRELSSTISLHDNEDMQQLSGEKQNASQENSTPDRRCKGKQAFLKLFWHFHTDNMSARPCITWDGLGWRRGPSYLSHRNLQRFIRQGDYIQHSTDRPRAVRKNIIRERRSHLKKLFARFEKDVKKHFEEEVCFGQVTFDMKFIVTFKEVNWIVSHFCF
jgi:hypothetical protein